VKSMADLIKGHAFFQDLPDAVTTFIAGCGRNVVFAEGDYLLRAGGPADRFYLVRHGSVALELDVPGRGPLIFFTIGPDEVLGASWLVEPYVAHYDARALSDVRAIAFDAGCLRAKCESEPAVGYALMKRFVPALVARMQSARMQALDVYGRPA